VQNHGGQENEYHEPRISILPVAAPVHETLKADGGFSPGIYGEVFSPITKADAQDIALKN